MKHATSDLTWKRQLFLMLGVGIMLISGAGCQTCRLSEADFEKQQRGEMVDRQTGEAVEIIGSLAYFGFLLGEGLAAAFGK